MSSQYNEEPVFHISTSKAVTGEIIGECYEIPIVLEAQTEEELHQKMEKAIETYKKTFPKKFAERIKNKRLTHLTISNMNNWITETSLGLEMSCQRQTITTGSK